LLQTSHKCRNSSPLREATEAGVCSTVFAELTTPAAPYRNGNFFLMVRPPLLAEEGNVAPSNMPRWSEA
jgi:hypothetical protein